MMISRNTEIPQALCNLIFRIKIAFISILQDGVMECIFPQALRFKKKLSELMNMLFILFNNQIMITPAASEFE